MVNDKTTCLTCAVDYYKSVELCVKCNKGYFQSKINNECSKLCEDGYYGDSELRECMACNSACKTCKGPDIDDCTAC